MNAPPAFAPEDFGERLWLRWSADSLPAGPVASWADSVVGLAAAQPAASLQPAKNAAGYVSFAAGQKLEFPYQSTAHQSHRALVFVFRLLNAAATNTADGSLFTVNGFQGSQGMRQPLVAYTRTSVDVQWTAPQPGSYATIPLADAGWHVLVSRRVNGVIYNSLDGGPETATGEGITLPKYNGSVAGLIGDFRSGSNTQFDVSEILILQDDLSAANAHLLAAWALWKVGAQSRLPASSPFASAAPNRLAYVAPAPFVESTAAEWAETAAVIGTATRFRAGRPEALDLTGYSVVFEDDFTTMTVAGESVAPSSANWFSPVHPAAVGGARNGLIGGTPNVWSQAGSELTISLLKHTDNNWYSGVMTSVNLDGQGRAWQYGYFEMRAKFGNGNGFGAWPAFWLKSLNQFKRLTESYMELDVLEAYNSSGNQHHSALHNWPAQRVQPGRITANRHAGDVSTIRTTAGFSADVNLFDGQFHDYGCKLEADFVSIYFDGQLVGRYPTPIECKQPVYILIDLALFSQEAAQAVGPYTMTIDRVRVLQRA
jgi:hypothetical protein